MTRFVSLDAFFSALPALAAEHADQLLGLNGCVALAPKGRGAAAFSIQPDGGVARVDPAVVQPDCTVHAAEEDMLAIVNGEMKPVKAFMAGRVEVDGSVALLMKLMKLFA